MSHHYPRSKISSNSSCRTETCSMTDDLADEDKLSCSKSVISNSDDCSSPITAQHYEEEWTRYFKTPDYFSFVKTQGIEGRLRNCRFRSICWRIYLQCLPKDQSLWLKEAYSGRDKYNFIKAKYLTNPRMDDFAVDLDLNNPLSQAESSPWNRYFQDSELKITISQDVIRTFPEIEFFHLQNVRDMMVNILFCYAREYQQMSYKQGMHEILAPIIFVLHSDHQAFLHALEIELLDMFDESSSDHAKTLLDPNFIEHDAFLMFVQVMKVLEHWYLIHDIYPNKASSMSVRLFARPQDMHPINVIIHKLTCIQDDLLQTHDSQLYQHLEKLEIAPQIYGIRWLRLLFGREFPLQDLLVIWDVIFADSIRFDLVDYIFISMLIFIRDLLLNSDYAGCLSYLMKFPAVTDVQYIIDVALHLRDPSNYTKPCGYSSHMLHHKPTVGGRVDIHRAPPSRNQSPESVKDQNSSTTQRSRKVVSGFSTMTKKVVSRPKTLVLNQELLKTGQTAVKASSEPATFESRSPSPTLSDYVHENTSKRERKQTCSVDTELKALSNKANGSHKIRSDESEVIDAGAVAKRTLNRKGSWSFNLGKELKYKGEAAHDGARLSGQLHDLQAMSDYCSSKMTIHIDRLQDCILKQNLENEDEMLIALAGLKQVRDILQGTLKFTHNVLDGDDIVISDNHYNEPTDVTSSEDSQINILSDMEVSQSK